MVGRRRPAPVIVELAGLPGSGKTTLARAAADVLRAGGTEVRCPTDVVASRGRIARSLTKAVSAGLQLACHPVRSTRMLAAVRRSRQRSGADGFRVGLNCLYVSRVLARARRDAAALVLLDQGGIQALESVRLRARDTTVLADSRAWALLLRADLCIHLDVDAETAAARLAGRGGAQSRVEEEAPGELRMLLDAVRAGLAGILAMAGRSGVEIVTVDARASIDAGVVARALTSRVHEPRT